MSDGSLTRVSVFDDWTAKREDEAAYSGPDYPSGSKVRQYAAMALANPGLPMLVGCSADSAMQVYIAAAAKQAGVPAIVYTAARQRRSSATEYAIAMGAEVNEIRPAYLSVSRSRAKKRGDELGAYVHWDPDRAVLDTMAQCANIPMDMKRVVVPTGSGLTCSGVLAGLAEYGINAKVLAVAVSKMASEELIIEKAAKLTKLRLPRFELKHANGTYNDWFPAVLPDGTPLDPYYSAKAMRFVRPGDCLWLPALRPLSAMPLGCQLAIKALQVELNGQA